MRRFELHRTEDMSGVSGVGVVAEGVEFSDASAVIHWFGEWPTTTVHPEGIVSINAIHGHNGRTKIVWL